MTEQPHVETMPTADLSRLAAAMRVLDQHAELNRRYRKLVDDSQQQLAADEVRLTQARGMAKKLMVLVKAAGEDMRGQLSTAERDALDAGMTQANELVYGT